MHKSSRKRELKRNEGEGQGEDSGNINMKYSLSHFGGTLNIENG